MGGLNLFMMQYRYNFVIINTKLYGSSHYKYWQFKGDHIK